MRFHIGLSSSENRHFVTQRWVARDTEVGPNMRPVTGDSKNHGPGGRC